MDFEELLLLQRTLYGQSNVNLSPLKANLVSRFPQIATEWESGLSCNSQCYCCLSELEEKAHSHPLWPQFHFCGNCGDLPRCTTCERRCGRCSELYLSEGLRKFHRMKIANEPGRTPLYICSSCAATGTIGDNIKRNTVENLIQKIANEVRLDPKINMKFNETNRPLRFTSDTAKLESWDAENGWLSFFVTLENLHYLSFPEPCVAPGTLNQLNSPSMMSNSNPLHWKYLWKENIILGRCLTSPHTSNTHSRYKKVVEAAQEDQRALIDTEHKNRLTRTRAPAALPMSTKNSNYQSYPDLSKNRLPHIQRQPLIPAKYSVANGRHLNPHANLTSTPVCYAAIGTAAVGKQPLLHHHHHHNYAKQNYYDYYPASTSSAAASPVNLAKTEVYYSERMPVEIRNAGHWRSDVRCSSGCTKIEISNGLPEDVFTSVLIHEFTHAYIYAEGLRLPRLTEEGVCNAVEMVYLTTKLNKYLAIIHTLSRAAYSAAAAAAAYSANFAATAAHQRSNQHRHKTVGISNPLLLSSKSLSPSAAAAAAPQLSSSSSSSSSSSLSLSHKEEHAKLLLRRELIVLRYRLCLFRLERILVADIKENIAACSVLFKVLEIGFKPCLQLLAATMQK